MCTDKIALMPSLSSSCSTSNRSRYMRWRVALTGGGGVGISACMRDMSSALICASTRFQATLMAAAASVWLLSCGIANSDS